MLSCKGCISWNIKDVIKHAKEKLSIFKDCVTFEEGKGIR